MIIYYSKLTSLVIAIYYIRLVVYFKFGHFCKLRYHCKSFRFSIWQNSKSTTIEVLLKDFFPEDLIIIGAETLWRHLKNSLNNFKTFCTWMVVPLHLDNMSLNVDRPHHLVALSILFCGVYLFYGLRISY